MCESCFQMYKKEVLNVLSVICNFVSCTVTLYNSDFIRQLLNCFPNTDLNYNVITVVIFLVIGS